MISLIFESLKNMVKSRLFTLVFTYIILFCILIGRMFYLQIVKGEVYEQEASLKKQKVKSIKSSRGKIFDSQGKLLATNEQTYAVTIEDTGELKDTVSKNKVISKCIKLIEKNGDKIALDFPISISKKGKFSFNVSKSAQLRFKRDIFYKKDVNELTEEQKNMSAFEIFKYIRTTNSVNTIKFFDPENEPDYDDIEALKIMTIRYAMFMNTYSKYEAITISTNVCEKTVAAIKESAADMPGVEVSTETKRVYYNSKYFSHIIGYTGMISSDSLEEIKEKDPKTQYTSQDQIGKTGIEKVYEDELKGSKGSETLTIDSSSRVIDSKKTKDAVAGKDIYLSIDSKLQKAVYRLAEKEIAGILSSKLVNSKSHGTKGKKASGILVSIYDVYDSIMQNSIVDIEHFTDEKASALEKSTYKQFVSAKKNAINKIKAQLTYNNKIPGIEVSKTLDDYLDYIYSILKTEKIINSDTLDTTDSYYNKFINNKVSLSEFITYSIKNNWINLETLNIGEDYFSSEEVFNKIISYVLDFINDDISFDKKVYHEMVKSNKLTGREICLLLYDQGVLKKNNVTYQKLMDGELDPYNFIKAKIKSLDISPGELGLTPCSCSIVINDIKTGKVKAMVSYPSYDNNMLANTVNKNYYSKVSTSSASMLLNRATQQKTAPGSTFKMVTATTMLEEGYINPYTAIKDQVQFTKINKPWPKCWSSVSHGKINVTQAIQHSCNYFFYEMGYRLGNGKKNVVDNEKGLNVLKKYANKYGLTSKSGIELPEAEPSFSDTDIVRSAIGQGTNSYTPTQLSRYVTTIANGGTCYDLTIVDKISDNKNNKTKENKAKVKSTLDLDVATLSSITNGMNKVVKNGSITSLFKNIPVNVAGKTGTAQITANEPNHALFVSYAPFENPEISVTVQIPNGFSSSNAAELASNIYKYYYEPKARKKLLNSKVTGPKITTTGVTD